MDKLKKLPDAEFEIMRAIWQLSTPTTCREIMEQLNTDKSWKSQTVLTMLKRLEEKGFVKSQKIGKEREYFPVVSEDDYLRIETGAFIHKFGKKSAFSVINALYSDEDLSSEEIEDLSKWLQQKKRGQS